jgi:hypothetical protein
VLEIKKKKQKIKNKMFEKIKNILDEAPKLLSYIALPISSYLYLDGELIGAFYFILSAIAYAVISKI